MFAIFPDDGKWFAPVPLAGKEPVAQLVIDGFLAQSFFLKPGGDFTFGLSGGESVEER